MRLISVELQDFRGFYGRHRLELADGDDKRVTVFYGENGAGKTNLLNAIHWCFTGQFTPRFQDKGMLINKEAYREGRRECSVEIAFRDEPERGGIVYRVRRSADNDRQLSFEVFRVERGNSSPVPKGDALLRTLIPPGLISWFFFDAEAIGALELSGSPEFKQDLRKTLGFDLVDALVADLESVYDRRRKDITNLSNDKTLRDIQIDIDNIDHVLPEQKETVARLQSTSTALHGELESVRQALSRLPQAEPLERRRREIESQQTRLEHERRSKSVRSAQLMGLCAPPLILLDATRRLEGKLEDQEVKGRLPSPFSDQLVNDILKDKLCICGRPVNEGSAEAHKIHDLLRTATTGLLNTRISDVRYLIRDIERYARSFPIDSQSIRSDLAKIDTDLGQLEAEHKQLTEELQGIRVEENQTLEQQRKDLSRKQERVLLDLGAAQSQLASLQKRREELQARYESAAKKLDLGKKVRAEFDKTERLIRFLKDKSRLQEGQALLFLSNELNGVLGRYLTKDYQARIDPKTYEVRLLDTEGRRVGHSTGEGQVLKFAFIAAVVAMAAKKTTLKIQWLSDPTVAPLVLDAPFSALDPVYQGSVARNLAAQTTQLVLMISSAAWGESVAQALEGVVGKRYLIVSKERGQQGARPVKTISIEGKTYKLNVYGANRAESVFEEVC